MATMVRPKARAVSRYPLPLAASQPTSMAVPQPTMTRTAVPIASAMFFFIGKNPPTNEFLAFVTDGLPHGGSLPGLDSENVFLPDETRARQTTKIHTVLYHRLKSRSRGGLFQEEADGRTLRVTVHTLTAPEWRDTSKKMNNFRPRRLSHDT